MKCLEEKMLWLLLVFPFLFFLKLSGVIYLFSLGPLGLGEFLVIILLHVLLCFARCEINVFSVT